ncbi:MAG: nucleoside-diphosphate sugar epimerase/dehydratase [Pseudomonadota bacterium]
MSEGGKKQSHSGVQEARVLRIQQIVDAGLVLLSLGLAIAFLTGSFPTASLMDMSLPGLMACAATVFALWVCGGYEADRQPLTPRTLGIVAVGVLCGVAVISIYSAFNNQLFVQNTVPIIFGIIAFGLMVASRLFNQPTQKTTVQVHHENSSTIVYGSGEAVPLSGLHQDKYQDVSFVGFLDEDNDTGNGNFRNGNIFPADSLDSHLKQIENLRVLICVDNIGTSRKRGMIERFKAYPFQFLTIPPPPDVVEDQIDVSEVREVRIEELLGREPVPPVKNLFEQAIENKTVLITGGGGSIGAEICRQVFQHKARKIIVYESSELALYDIENSLNELAAEVSEAPEVHYVLGSVIDEWSLKEVYALHKPELVYHAAAYKHVPIVETNVKAGLHNNVIGTYLAAKLAEKHKAERFILISTDKAVRPTNVMGASKRMAELVIQALAMTKTETIFTMVRFGNVLGSSGSVIPLFKKQIAQGGPVSVTHPDITRYFMTISEASQLVIQAGSIAKGGEVFLLDMGEPIKISKLAQLMIQLSGKTARDKDNPNGQIDITYTGLRPGEKLYEELLVTDNALGTLHPKIMMAKEKHITPREMEKSLKQFRTAIEKNDVATCLDILSSHVEEFAENRP